MSSNHILTLSYLQILKGCRIFISAVAATSLATSVDEIGKNFVPSTIGVVAIIVNITQVIVNINMMIWQS